LADSLPGGTYSLLRIEEIPENGVPYVQNDQTDSIFIAVSTLLAIIILDKEQRLYHFFRIDGYRAPFR
jgi:hypothetical protein